MINVEETYLHASTSTVVSFTERVYRVCSTVKEYRHQRNFFVLIEMLYCIVCNFQTNSDPLVAFDLRWDQVQPANNRGCHRDDVF